MSVDTAGANARAMEQHGGGVSAALSNAAAMAPDADRECERASSLKSLAVIIEVSGAGFNGCNGTYLPCEPFKDVSSTNPAWRRETAEETCV